MLQVVGARDQRVTALVVSVLLGASVLTNLLMLKVVGTRDQRVTAWWCLFCWVPRSSLISSCYRWWALGIRG
jgi:hypothetical protein